MSQITVTHSIFIARSPEEVWDFTQDYEKRMLWDISIKGVTVLQTAPRIVFVKGQIICAELVYKLDERPRKTTLAMQNVSSYIIEGGGGSWEYKAVGEGTEWVLTNTLILRDKLYAKLLSPIIKGLFTQATRKAMRKAKKLIEQ